MDHDESPLIKALPPKSDYLTYLTIIEYNLTPENLPILHRVLQDETLTTNIGWDLVHLLVPLLPESEQCLHDVAHLGNPREVILKVTESLRLIDYHLDIDEDAPPHSPHGSDAQPRAESSTHPLKTAPVGGSATSSQAVELPSPQPLPISQFAALLSMLTILHQRIKTKYPSRFLSTTLQAILASFSNSSTHREEMIESIVETVKGISGIQRPALPSRRSSGMVSIKASGERRSGADPEAGNDSDLGAEESSLQTRLLQAFVTHVIEEYMLNLPRHEDIPGMAWCSRIMEKVHPERQIPGRSTFSSRFSNEPELESRVEATGRLVALAKDLQITDRELLETAITVEKLPTQHGDEEEPPKRASDIPLSRLGSVLLYAARQTSSVLYNGRRDEDASFALFPDHHELVKNCLASADMGSGQLGTEPESLLDAILALGLVCLENDSIGSPDSDEDFNHYLQTVAFISSNCPNSNLRGHAHYVTTTVLRSQPDDKVRLDFIRDTLEHCPYENLKVSAVAWAKGETIEANPPTPVPGHTADGDHSHDAAESKSIFATPYALDSLGPFLFPSLQADLVTAPIQEAWVQYQANCSFYLASLNFLYLLLAAEHLHHSLDILDLWSNNDIAGSFIQPLKDASGRFAKELEDGAALASEKSEETVAELQLMDETIRQVTQSAARLSKT